MSVILKEDFVWSEKRFYVDLWLMFTYMSPIMFAANLNKLSLHHKYSFINCQKKTQYNNKNMIRFRVPVGDMMQD